MIYELKHGDPSPHKNREYALESIYYKNGIFLVKLQMWLSFFHN